MQLFKNIVLSALKVEAREITNSDEIDRHIAILLERAQTDQVKKWLKKTYRKHLINNAKGELVTTPDPSYPDYANDAIKAGQEVFYVKNLNKIPIQPIIDYLNTLDSINFGYDQAKKKSDAWHESLKNKAPEPGVTPDDNSEIVRTYDNGWSWRLMQTQSDYTRETDFMGHCVGKSYTIGKQLLYSLRDAKNEPHVTLETDLEPPYTIKQVKGQANKVPRKYKKYIVDFMKNYIGEESIEKNDTSNDLIRLGIFFNEDSIIYNADDKFNNQPISSLPRNIENNMLSMGLLPIDGYAFKIDDVFAKQQSSQIDLVQYEFEDEDELEEWLLEMYTTLFERGYFFDVIIEREPGDEAGLYVDEYGDEVEDEDYMMWIFSGKIVKLSEEPIFVELRSIFSDVIEEALEEENIPYFLNESYFEPIEKVKVTEYVLTKQKELVNRGYVVTKEGIKRIKQAEKEQIPLELGRGVSSRSMSVKRHLLSENKLVIETDKGFVIKDSETFIEEATNNFTEIIDDPLPKEFYKTKDAKPESKKAIFIDNKLVPFGLLHKFRTNEPAVIVVTEAVFEQINEKFWSNIPKRFIIRFEKVWAKLDNIRGGDSIIFSTKADADVGIVESNLVDVFCETFKADKIKSNSVSLNRGKYISIKDIETQNLITTSTSTIEIGRLSCIILHATFSVLKITDLKIEKTLDLNGSNIAVENINTDKNMILHEQNSSVNGKKGEDLIRVFNEEYRLSDLFVRPKGIVQNVNFFEKLNCLFAIKYDIKNKVEMEEAFDNTNKRKWEINVYNKRDHTVYKYFYLTPNDIKKTLLDSKNFIDVVVNLGKKPDTIEKFVSVDESLFATETTFKTKPGLKLIKKYRNTGTIT